MQNKMKGKIFNAQEIQAMLNGSKVMFREVIKNNLLKSCYKIGSYDSFTGKSESEMMPCNHSWAGKRIGAICSDCWKELIAKCPYKVGQKIFCKETYKNIYIRGVRGAWFKASASDNAAKYEKWLPPMALPQHLSRLTLLIKEIRVERLNEISNADCRSEGEDQWSFICNWNATHKKPEEKFEASPWVWVINFEVVDEK